MTEDYHLIFVTLDLFVYGTQTQFEFEFECMEGDFLADRFLKYEHYILSSIKVNFCRS